MGGEDSFLHPAGLGEGSAIASSSSVGCEWVKGKGCFPLMRVKGLWGPCSSEHTWMSASKTRPSIEICVIPCLPMASPNHMGRKESHLPTRPVLSASYLFTILTAITGKFTWHVSSTSTRTNKRPRVRLHTTRQLTWLVIGLILKPRLFKSLSSCSWLKLDTPMFFTRPSITRSSMAWERKRCAVWSMQVVQFPDKPHLFVTCHGASIL